MCVCLGEQINLQASQDCPCYAKKECEREKWMQIIHSRSQQQQQKYTWKQTNLCATMMTGVLSLI